METRVLLFGPPAIDAATDSITVTTPDAPDCSQMVAAISDQFPLLRKHAKAARLAVNGRYGDDASRIGPGDEVALICMVSGG
jgi:molybdopterin converting factor small subunit